MRHALDIQILGIVTHVRPKFNIHPLQMQFKKRNVYWLKIYRDVPLSA